ncbi:YsnF/AvaK domain-containing protein [Methylobacter luteus]|uniref:YsnF/AvaK domain-containing protein n=1 Tax=Methylobacter luteus TaxID=415 RepID=UPI00048417C0|nr:YsnF/AvaK domain-containing protein [Methylobacter luteus]
MGQKDNSPQASHQPGQGLENRPTELDAGHATVIPVIEERLRVDKKTVETGAVRISKQVTEHEETVTVPLAYEEIQVERVAINRLVDSPLPSIRYEGETMIIPVIKEVAVVEKRLMLVEELHVIKRQNQKQETHAVNLRAETVSVEHININRSDAFGAEQSGC